jgi:hypothetical protein
MPTYVDQQYGTLSARQSRVDIFFTDLEAKLLDISAPSCNHLDIEWDGSKVKISATGDQISSLSLASKLKYYNQGLGLMKLAINKQLYPA